MPCDKQSWCLVVPRMSNTSKASLERRASMSDDLAVEEGNRRRLPRGYTLTSDLVLSRDNALVEGRVEVRIKGLLTYFQENEAERKAQKVGEGSQHVVCA